jgi:hypothetical protein
MLPSNNTFGEEQEMWFWRLYNNEIEQHFNLFWAVDHETWFMNSK